MPATERKWIAFDAAGTLFETAQPVENVYADCFSTLGFGLPEKTWKTAFRRAFELTPDPIYAEPGKGDETEKEWWRELVRNAALSTGIRPDPETLNTAFDELFDHYAVGSSWSLFPETKSVLTDLNSKGVGLAVVSNFDSRLHPVLEELGITSHFDFILTSADAGARKPSPSILHSLMEKANTTPSDICLVGDSELADDGAADAAAIPFFHIKRPTTDLSHFSNWHRQRFS
ncbi:MAG: HAD-IA family hydrolase [Akkermansiaceae bacterium]|nr:HAD-IA family hydrolase [Akkermansiaceae bacterium]